MVFVQSGGRRRGGGQYSNIRDRLERMSFEVTRWSGRPRPPQPKPTAEKGQPLVYIFFPSSPRSPRAAMRGQQGMSQALKKHLKAGKPALVFVSTQSPLAAMGGGGNKYQVLKKRFGITPKTSGTVVSARTQRGRTVATRQVRIRDWPKGHPITGAVRGLQGIAVGAARLDLASDPPKGVKLWPLIRTPEDTWAESQARRRRQLRQAERNNSEPAGPFVTGAAAKKNGQRVVVIADQMWANDRVTGAGATNLAGETLYKFFPANLELVVNSIYWLAGKENLIAPAPAPVERIGAIGENAKVAMWPILLGAVPFVCLVLGGVVWFVRTR